MKTTGLVLGYVIVFWINYVTAPAPEKLKITPVKHSVFLDYAQFARKLNDSLRTSIDSIREFRKHRFDSLNKIKVTQISKGNFVPKATIHNPGKLLVAPGVKINRRAGETIVQPDTISIQ